MNEKFTNVSVCANVFIQLGVTMTKSDPNCEHRPKPNPVSQLLEEREREREREGL